MADQRPVQHTPVHLRPDTPDVIDPKHPAASAFAPAQPAAGVVADDVEEKGQNLAGGETATQAEGTFADQREVLAEQHAESLKATVVATDAALEVDPAKGTAKPAGKKADSAEGSGK